MKKILILLALSLFTTGCQAWFQAEVENQPPNNPNNNGVTNRCQLQPDPGQCTARMTKYYYNQDNKKCETFIYGGCGGTVPFESLETCQQTCENIDLDQEASNQVNFNLNQQAKLKIGQTGVIGSENLKITALSVGDDSRCPLDVVCIWQGQVSAKFILTQNDQSLGEFDLISLAGDNNVAIKTLSAYQVRLVSVEPEKLSDQLLTPADYTFTIEIIKK